MRVLSALLGFFAVLPAVQAGEARFATTLPAAQRGFLHPVVAVGFDAQPRGPAPRWRTELGPGGSPVVAAEQAPGSRTDIRLTVAWGDPHLPGEVESLSLPAEICGTRRDVVLFPAVGEVALPPGPCSQGRLAVDALFSDGTTMRFFLAIGAEGAAWRDVHPGAIVGFDPQPDPPREATVVLSLRFPVEVTHVSVVLSGQTEAGGALIWR